MQSKRQWLESLKFSQYIYLLFIVLFDLCPFVFRKFADIGSTVKHQVGEGVFAVAEWADLVTVHAIPGAGILKALREVCQNRPRPLGCVLVAEMSSEGNLITEEYTKCEFLEILA